MAATPRERFVEVAKVVAVVWAVSLLTRAAFLTVGFTNVDEGAHMVGARELLAGGRLYVDFADNKPPIIYAFYALAPVLGAGPLGVRLLAALVGLPAIAVSLAAFFDFDRRGRAAAVLFLVASATLLPSDAHAINGEHIFLIPIAAAVALTRAPASLARPGRMLLVGALVGLASLAKQPAALCGVAFAWSALRTPGLASTRRLAVLACLAAGFVLPLAAAVAFFARQGSLDAFVFWVYRYNLVHVNNPMPLGDRLLQLLEMGSVLIPSVGTLALAYALGARAGVLAEDLHRRRLIAGLVVTTLLPAFLGWRLFGHYFVPTLFALSLGAAPYLVDLRSPARKAMAGVLVVGLVAFTIGGRVVHDPARHLTDVDDPRYEGLAAQMPARCGVARPLFVWGYAPQLYVQSGLRPASRFVVPIDTITGYIVGNDAFARGAIDTRNRIVPEHWDWLMADLERSRPEYIVDTAPGDLNHWARYPLTDFPRLDAFVRRDYRVHATVGGAVVYRRADCP
ncbi:MAG TPA: hypothetical protein VLM85_34095 [Polyangiaceae bacterium]|nr:hypothetical protein [Polyangiaceae bacterium]